MRIDRLELATPSETVELPLHPRITIVTGLGPLEREALTAEILSAIGPGRPGLSVDVVTDEGRILAIRRPIVGSPQVLDALDGTDVTTEFAEGTTVDLLSRVGISKHLVREKLRVGPRDLQTETQHDERITRLAVQDQADLWSRATALAEVEVEIARNRGKASSAIPTKLDNMVDLIEERHAALEIATDRLEKTRHNMMATAITLALLGMIFAVGLHPLLVVPFVLGSIGAGVYSWWRYQEVLDAEQQEVKVLNEAGLPSYLSFQMIQVDALTRMPEVRGHTIELSEIHRMAKSSWAALAGDTTVEWAVTHRDEIEAVSNGHGMPGVIDLETVEPVEWVASIRDHLVEAAGAYGETLPVILDNPFAKLDDFDLAASLSIVDDHATSGQLVLMTEDVRVIGWGLRLVNNHQATVLHLGGDVQKTPTTAPLPSMT